MAPLLVTVDQDLGVGVVGREYMAGRLKMLAELRRIVDLTIEDDPDRSVLVPHRLCAALDIEHREPAMSQKHLQSCIDMITGAIGTAMPETLRHRDHIGLISTTDQAYAAEHT